MVLSDVTIKKLCTPNKIPNTHVLIENFLSEQVSKINNKKLISYGLSSYGYDARLSNEFVIYEDPEQPQVLKEGEVASNYMQSIIDPKVPKSRIVKKIITDERLILAPHGFLMGLTVEKFNMPRDMLGICIGKSTYARCGLIINVTPIEPGCSGRVVIEISNTTNLPVYIYPNEGICQVIFFKGDQTCSISYKDKSGKYLNQDEIVLPFAF